MLFKWLLWMVMLFNNSMGNVLKWQRGKRCFTKIVQVLSSKKPQCCWTLMLTAPDFFLKHFRVSLKNSPGSWRRAKALHTHTQMFCIWENKKEVPDIYILTPFPFFVWLCTTSAARHECQFPWVTEVNLTLHSFQTEYVATFLLFPLVSRQTVYSLLTHPILLAIPTLTSKFPKASI